MKNLWVRVGMTIHLTDAEAERILGGDDGGAAALRTAVLTALAENRAFPDGESYVPECEVEAFNRVYKTSYEVYPIETDI